ncbi:hypothetical protein, partial [Desulfomarina sp.]
MHKGKNRKQIIVTTLLDTGSQLGRLCLAAAKDLEQTGFCTVKAIKEIVSEHQQKKMEKTVRILVVDGADSRGYSFLRENGIIADHHLVAADLGLGEDDGEEAL